jgi:serine/threonine protein kinase
MPTILCPHCRKPLGVPDNLVGRLVRCAHCAGVALVPQTATVGAAGRSPPPRGSATSPTSAADEVVDFARLLAPAQQAGELGRLGPYRVLELLGQGGMGVVFRAEDPQLGRPVALKVLLPSVGASAEGRARFLREARAAAALQHDHVVTVYQVGEDRGVPYLAMQLLEGETLEDRLRREPLLALRTILRIGREVADALAAAHARQLIHRDIKPSNIWLEAGRDRVKVLDFGLARLAGDDARVTQAGAVIGTPAYMSPEQARGREVGPAGDLFSLGCVLYHLTTGQLPFRGRDTLATLSALAVETPPPVRKLNPASPPELSGLIAALLAKEPADRPASAREVLDELADIEQALLAAQTLLPGAVPPVDLEEPTRVRESAGWRHWALAADAAALLLFLSGLYLIYRTVVGPR